MLRRPPTVITLTSDDLAAYDVSRAQRQRDATLLRQQKERAVDYQAEEHARQRQELEQELLRMRNARANETTREDRHRTQRQAEQHRLQQRQTQAGAPSQPPPQSSSITPQTQQSPQNAAGRAWPDINPTSRILARQRHHIDPAAAPHHAAPRPPRRRMQMPTGNGSPPERSVQDVDMDLSGDESTPTATDEDDDETGELDDSMAGAGSGREAHARAQSRHQRLQPGRRQHHGLDDPGPTARVGDGRAGGSFETPTGPPAARDDGDARAVRRIGRPEMQQQQQQQQQQQRQQTLTRHERIIGRVEAPAPEGMGGRRMR